MKNELTGECLNDKCRTIVVGLGYRLDGIKCPRCKGPVIIRPFEPKEHQATERAIFVRSKILERNIKNCRDLTPEQVDSVLDIYDEYLKSNKEVDIEKAIRLKILTIDEVRKHFGLSPIPNGKEIYKG